MIEERDEEMKKKCAICNSTNDKSRLYCVNCGSFLHKDSSRSEPKAVKSIWEINEEPTIIKKEGTGGDTVQKQAGKKAAQKVWAIVCPSCHTTEILKNGSRPFFCSKCGYVYQTTDRVIEKISDVDGGESHAKDIPKRRGPMRRASEDVTYLRLIGINGNQPFMITASPENTVLGTEGNIGKEIFRHIMFGEVLPRQIQMYRSPTGWYLQALEGTPILNGEPLRQRISRRLVDGDFLMIGSCCMRIEISAQAQSEVIKPAASMRIIGTSKEHPFILNIKPYGDRFRNDFHVWLGAGKWHIRPLHGFIIQNGIELNAGVNAELSNGDILNVGQLNLRVELMVSDSERA